MIELSICAELFLIKSICLASPLHPRLTFLTQMDMVGFSHLSGPLWRHISHEYLQGMSHSPPVDVVSGVMHLCCWFWPYACPHCKAEKYEGFCWASLALKTAPQDSESQYMPQNACNPTTDWAKAKKSVVNPLNPRDAFRNHSLWEAGSI